MPIQGQVARTGILKHPAEEAEGKLDEMFWMVRLGEPSNRLALCRTSPSAQKARLQVFSGRRGVGLRPSVSFVVYTSADSTAGGRQSPNSHSQLSFDSFPIC